MRYVKDQKDKVSQAFLQSYSHFIDILAYGPVYIEESNDGILT